MQFTQASLIVQGQNNVNQESIPVGCVPTAEVASTMGGGSRVYPALGYPTPCFPDYSPGYPADPRYITTPKKGHETKDSLPHERNWYQGYPTPNVDRHLWKHYLPATSFAVGKYHVTCSEPWPQASCPCCCSGTQLVVQDSDSSGAARHDSQQSTGHESGTHVMPLVMQKCVFYIWRKCVCGGGGGGRGQGSMAPFLTYFYTEAGEDSAWWRLNRFHVS